MTNAQLIERLRSAAQDTSVTRPERSNTTLGLILTDAQDFLNVMLELCRKAFSLTLVSGTSEYAVDADFVAFPRDRLRKRGGCVYWSSGNLEPATPEELDCEVAGWRAATAATPTRFYLQTGDNGATPPVSVTKLGLYTAPSASFVTTVPTLTYYGLKRPAAITSNALLPFDNNAIFQPLHRLLVLHAMFSLDLEDGRLGDPAARQQRWQTFLSEIETAQDILFGRVKAQGGMRFDKDWRS